MKNLEHIIKSLTELSKLLNKGNSLKLEIHNVTWYAVRDVDKFEKEIFHRHTQRITKEMFGDLQFFKGVGHEIHHQVPKTPLIQAEPTKHELDLKFPSPSEIRAIRGKDEDVKDFAEKHKGTLFYDIKRDKFILKT